MAPPVALAIIFVSGLIVIPAFDRCAHQVTEVLVFLMATVVLVMVVLFLCDRWPNYCANPRMPVAVTSMPLSD